MSRVHCETFEDLMLAIDVVPANTTITLGTDAIKRSCEALVMRARDADDIDEYHTAKRTFKEAAVIYSVLLLTDASPRCRDIILNEASHLKELMATAPDVLAAHMHGCARTDPVTFRLLSERLRLR